jgi:hypothetical protein
LSYSFCIMFESNRKHHTIKKGDFDELDGDVTRAIYTSYHHI